MANWKYRINLSDIWDNEEMSVQDKGKEVAKRIRKVFPDEWFDHMHDDYDQDIEDIAIGFEEITGYDNVTPVQEFDLRMDDLYDFGDMEVEPYGKWPSNKMAWIATSF